MSCTSSSAASTGMTSHGTCDTEIRAHPCPVSSKHHPQMLPVGRRAKDHATSRAPASHQPVRHDDQTFFTPGHTGAILDPAITKRGAPSQQTSRMASSHEHGARHSLQAGEEENRHRGYGHTGSGVAFRIRADQASRPNATTRGTGRNTEETALHDNTSGNMRSAVARTLQECHPG